MRKSPKKKDCSYVDVRTTHFGRAKTCYRFLDNLQLLPVNEESPETSCFVQLEVREYVGVLHVLAE